MDQALNPDRGRTQPYVGQKELENIKKNIFIRNAIQHRNNIIDSYIIKKLGREHQNSIEILDELGNVKLINEGEMISLSLPEINSFKSSIYLIAEIWRGNYEQL